LGLRQEFLPSSGYLEEEKGKRELKCCGGAREHHVKGQSVNNKKDTTSFKVSKKIYKSILQDFDNKKMTG
jgi:hypothetical protein